MTNDFISNQDIKSFYTAFDNISYKIVTLIGLYETHQTTNTLLNSIEKLTHDVLVKDPKCFATKLSTITIVPTEIDFNALDFYSQSHVHSVLSIWIRGCLKLKICKLLKDNNCILASTILLDEIKKQVTFINDYQIAVVLSEMKASGQIDYIEAKFGSLYLPYGSIELKEDVK
jgi:hypothetical protein